MQLKLKLVTTSPGGWTKTKLMLFLTEVEVGVDGGWLAASYYNSFEVRLYFSRRTADARVEVIIMLSQLSDVGVE